MKTYDDGMVGSGEISVAMTELDKQRYALLLRAVQLGLMEIGIGGVEFRGIKQEDGRLKFEVVKRS